MAFPLAPPYGRRLVTLFGAFISFYYDFLLHAHRSHGAPNLRALWSKTLVPVQGCWLLGFLVILEHFGGNLETNNLRSCRFSVLNRNGFKYVRSSYWIAANRLCVSKKIMHSIHWKQESPQKCWTKLARRRVQTICTRAEHNPNLLTAFL